MNAYQLNALQGELQATTNALNGILIKAASLGCTVEIKAQTINYGDEPPLLATIVVPAVTFDLLAVDMVPVQMAFQAALAEKIATLNPEKEERWQKHLKADLEALAKQEASESVGHPESKPLSTKGQRTQLRGTPKAGKITQFPENGRPGGATMSD
jgi:hypothetical protein